MSMLAATSVAEGLNPSALNLNFTSVPEGDYAFNGRSVSLPQGFSFAFVGKDSFVKGLSQLGERNTIWLEKVPGGKSILVARGTENDFTGASSDELKAALKEGVRLNPLQMLPEGPVEKVTMDSVVDNLVVRGALRLVDDSGEVFSPNLEMQLGWTLLFGFEPLTNEEQSVALGLRREVGVVDGFFVKKPIALHDDFGASDFLPSLHVLLPERFSRWPGLVLEE